MMEDEHQRARLDYYTKNRALHATLIVSVLFGLFSLLRMITHFSWNAEQFFLVIGYLFLVFFGSYVVSRYTFYTKLAFEESKAVDAKNADEEDLKNNNRGVIHLLGCKFRVSDIGILFDKADWGFVGFTLMLLIAVLFL